MANKQIQNFQNIAFNVKDRINSKLYFFIGNQSKGRKLKKDILILSSTGNSHGLFFPFHFYRMELAKQLNVFFQEVISDDLKDKLKMIEFFKGDIIFISMPLRINQNILPKQKVLEFFQLIKNRNQKKIIFFDISDNAISPYFDILPYVDLFLMPFIFKDTKDYMKPYLGGNKFADFISNRFGINPVPENEYFPELFYSSPLPNQLHKIVPSWNWILWKRLIKIYKSQKFKCINRNSRNLDISCRFNPYSGWCKFHRMQAYELLKALSGKYSIKASTEKISIKKYYAELQNSKISFSPFGWGEICPKDFEAIMEGCLLMKPSVEHLITFPQLLQANETYVPVEWDLSDLEVKVQEYLLNDEKRQKIIYNAATAYKDFFIEKRFLRKIQEILDLLD